MMFKMEVLCIMALRWRYEPEGPDGAMIGVVLGFIIFGILRIFGVW